MTFHFRTNEINYRKGFIDITPGIHTRLVNIESWMVSPKIDITALHRVTELDSDDDVTANIEMELSPNEARAIADALYKAAEIADEDLDELNC